MKNYIFTLEEIEYLLIKHNCEYLYGFHDSFVRYDREKVELRFEKIADTLEEKNYISRDFKGNLSFKEDIEEILDIIINVEVYYDINVIDVDVVMEKYRIYKKQNSFVVIRIFTNDKNELDFNNLVVYNISNDIFCEKVERQIDKLLKYEDVSGFTNIYIPTSLYNEITKLDENKFLEKVNAKNEDEKNSYQILYKVANRCNKIISVTQTDMSKRRSSVHMYINGLKKTLCLELKINYENNKWAVSALDKGIQKNEILKLFELE